MDWNEILSAVGGNPVILKTVVEAAVEESPQLLRMVQDAVASGDGMALQRATHTLKGSIAYFGKTEALRLTLQIEQMSKEGRLADAAAHLPDLQRELAVLTSILAAYAQSHSG